MSESVSAYGLLCHLLDFRALLYQRHVQQKAVDDMRGKTATIVPTF